MGKNKPQGNQMSESNSPKEKLRMSIVDIIIVSVLLLGVALYIVKYGVVNILTTEYKTIKYSIEVQNQEGDFIDTIAVGDIIRDGIKGKEIGEIISKEQIPYEEIVEDNLNGRYVKATLKDRYTVMIEIEAEAEVLPTEILLKDNKYDLKIGKRVYFRGKGYSGYGYILSIDGI